MIAVRGGLVDPAGPGHLRGAGADAVHLNVIGMAVVAVLVVDRQHVGLFALEDAGEARRRLLDVGARERTRSVVGRLSGHPRVEVVEELDAIDAEDLGRGVELGDPSVDEPLAGSERVGCVLAQLAARRGHEHDPVTFALGARHRAARGDGFVVGMGVKQDECVRHCSSWSSSCGAPHAGCPASLLSDVGSDVSVSQPR